MSTIRFGSPLNSAACSLHPANGGAHVVDARRPAMLGRESIVDREPGELGVGERFGRRHVFDGLVAAAPTAAVDENRHRKRPSPSGMLASSLRLLAVDLGVLDVRPKLGGDANPRDSRAAAAKQQLKRTCHAEIVDAKIEPPQRIFRGFLPTAVQWAAVCLEPALADGRS